MSILKVTKAPKFEKGFIPIGTLPPKSIMDAIKMNGGKK